MHQIEHITPSPMPLRFSDPERHETALLEALDVQFYGARNGQQFSTLVFNRAFLQSSKQALFTGGQFLGATPLPEEAYKGYTLAVDNPTTPVIVMDLPGHGFSSRQTLAQLSEIYKHRTVSGAGSAWAEATASVLKRSSVERLDVLCYSLGGLLLPSFINRASQLRLPVDTAVGIEVVGTDKKSVPRLMKNFYIDETKMQDRYKGKGARFDPDGVLNNHYETWFKGELARVKREQNITTRKYSLYSLYGRDPSIIASMPRSPLSTDYFFNAMIATLGTHPETSAAFYLSQDSAVNRLPHITDGFNRLAGLFPTRVIEKILDGHTHGVGIAPYYPFAAEALALARQRG
jgi:pimeloyl-ACP methyl ester carboxylesterase